MFPFRVRVPERETTGHDLVEQHAIIQEQHRLERDDLVRRHATDRRVLLEDAVARRTVLVDRMKDVADEIDAADSVVEALR